MLSLKLGTEKEIHKCSSFRYQSAIKTLVLLISIAFKFLHYLQFLGEDHAILADNNGKESEETKRETLQDDINAHIIVLPFRTINENKTGLDTNQNRIKDKEIYDQPTAKHNNVNERSFIYINQKYKTPVLNQLYNSQDLLKETYKSVVANIEDSRSKYPLYQESRKGYFAPNMQQKQNRQGSYFPPVHHKPNKPHKTIISENKKEFDINQIGKKVEEQHEYLELLKPPLLRPVMTGDRREDATKWDFPPPTFTNYQVLNTKPINSKSPSNAQQFSASYYDNYGFPTPYGYQRSIPHYKYETEENGVVTGFSGASTSFTGADNSIKKLLSENNIEISKYMERYLKDSLEEQVTNERINAKNNCSYSDCVIKSRKQYLHSRVSSEPECKCGRKLNVKRIRNEESNGYEARETSDRDEIVPTTETYVTSRSSEMNDYSDMLTEEMNLKKLIEE